MLAKVRISKTSKSGYELVDYINGQEKVFAIDKIENDGVSLKLPTNSSNRQWIKTTVVDASGGEVELKPKTEKSFGNQTKSSSQPKSNTLVSHIENLAEMLKGDEKESFLNLARKAMVLMAISEKKKQIEAIEAEIKELQK